MPGETIKIILDKSVPKPINLRPGYDLEHVINHHYGGWCDYSLIIRSLERERKYDNLSVIRPHETSQQ